MKIVYTLVLMLLVGINAATAWFVYQQMMEVKSEVKAVRDMPLTLPPAFESKFERDVNAIVAGVKESATKTMSDVKPSVEELLAAVQTNMLDMCKAKVLGNEIEAERAFALAERAIGGGDLPLAKIYCMNAINHSPTRKKYFQRLLEVYEKGGVVSKDDLEQLRSAFELGVYQVAADDVVALRDMLASTLDKIAKIDADEVAAQVKEAENQQQQTLALLKDGALALDVLLTNEVARVDGLRDRLTAISGIDKGALASNEVVWIESQEGQTRVLLDYYGLYASIDAYLTRAEKLLEEGEGKLGSVNVMVQSASQSLSQALGLDVSMLPEEAPDRLQGCAKRIEEIERNFNLIKSQQAIASIERNMELAGQVGVVAPYQAKIEELDRLLTAISQELSRVFADEKRCEYEGKMKGVASKLAECKQCQYRAYQCWAIERCDAGLKKYRSWYRVDIPDAKEVIDNYLIEIDSTLLTPDVSRLYQDVLGKQFAELKGETANMEIKMARAVKKGLKDF